jgi:predicted transcriptional regulator
MRVLLSIKPEFAEKIFDGSKKYEFRKVIFKDERVKKVVVYASYPISKVIGEFEIDDILMEELDTLWNLTKEDSGIHEDFYYQYFSNRDKGYAIKIKKAKLYSRKYDITKKYGVKPPQSFLYLNRRSI